MDSKTFKKQGYALIDWMAEYLETIESYPVKSTVKPKEVSNQIPDAMPSEGEPFEAIFEDFKDVIMPGVTHWQSPNFYAYFPANSSIPSLYAEMLTATLGVQGMKWETSPASTELEEKVIRWLQTAMNLPDDWVGVIHDTASTATLAALITAREQKTSYAINTNGFTGNQRFRVYCSSETHSSIEKGAKIAGLGKENVVKVASNAALEIDTEVLEEVIKEDITKGYIPLCIVAAFGTTGTTAVDSVPKLGALATKYDIWLHIDAAYAGSALLLPEYQYLIEGIAQADSFVFNPHKWLFTNFDCTAYYVKDKTALLNTFSILPEYLKTNSDGVVANHCDWGIPLGRRFRSLKLWFVMRHFGLTGLQAKIRTHIELAKWLEQQVILDDAFDLLADRTFNLVCFHFKPANIDSKADLNSLNKKLIDTLNASGKMYLSHTMVDGFFTLRMVIGQTNVSMEHVASAWKEIKKVATSLI